MGRWGSTTAAQHRCLYAVRSVMPQARSCCLRTLPVWALRALLPALSQREDEIVHRGSTRLWHGTTDKHAWTLTAKDAYRPNCRLFQVDKEAMAAAVAAARSHKQQQQERLAVAKQSSLRVTSPAAADAAGVQRIPAGEVGAGLPVVVGGASECGFILSAASWQLSQAFSAGVCSSTAGVLHAAGSLLHPSRRLFPSMQPSYRTPARVPTA